MPKSLPSKLTMSEQSIVLDVRCGYCAGKVRLEFRDWDEAPGSEPATWDCSYCAVTNRLPAFGRVVKVEKLSTDFKPVPWHDETDPAVFAALPPRQQSPARLRRGS
jgi:hypothetical protein